MKISDKVQRVMRAEKISAEELSYMLRHAAVISLRDCNRRYFHWCFRVDGNVLVSMEHVDILTIGQGATTVTEDHDGCLGEGCHGCGWIGKVVRSITDATEQYLTNAPQ